MLDLPARGQRQGVEKGRDVNAGSAQDLALSSLAFAKRLMRRGRMIR